VRSAQCDARAATEPARTRGTPLDIDHSIQSTSEGHSIFEGLRSTLARVREHRVRCVTGQRHRAAAPSRKRLAIE
jgi:hypothetical protein